MCFGAFYNSHWFQLIWTFKHCAILAFCLFGFFVLLLLHIVYFMFLNVYKPQSTWFLCFERCVAWQFQPQMHKQICSIQTEIKNKTKWLKRIIYRMLTRKKNRSLYGNIPSQKKMAARGYVVNWLLLMCISRDIYLSSKIKFVFYVLYMIYII